MNNMVPVIIYSGIVIIIVIVAFGVYRGANGRLVIYRNYLDLGLTAAAFLLPIGMVFLGVYVGLPSLGMAIGAVALFIGLAVVAIRTFTDNPGFLDSAHAFITKSLLCIIFALAIIEAFTGKNRRRRGAGSLIALLIGPITYALIRDRKDSHHAKLLRRFGA